MWLKPSSSASVLIRQLIPKFRETGIKIFFVQFFAVHFRERIINSTLGLGFKHHLFDIKNLPGSKKFNS